MKKLVIIPTYNERENVSRMSSKVILMRERTISLS